MSEKRFRGFTNLVLPEGGRVMNEEGLLSLTPLVRGGDPGFL